MTQHKDMTQQQSTNTFSCNYVRKKTQEIKRYQMVIGFIEIFLDLPIMNLLV